MGEKILALLSAGAMKKAKEIAQDLHVDAQAVKGLLHGRLSSSVQQDREYRWGLRVSENSPGPEGGAPAGISSSLSPTAGTDPALEDAQRKLCSYYLACLAEGGESGVSVYATSYNDLDYVELARMPHETAPGDVLSAPEVRKLEARLHQGRNKRLLRFGLPVLHSEGRGGHKYSKIEPLLLWTVGSAAAVSSIGAELPTLNVDAIQSLSGSGGRAMEEVLSLSRELGLDGDLPEAPELEEILLRLRDLRPEWPWKEPTSSTVRGGGAPLRECQGHGIFNRAVLVAVEEPSYTRGLREELSRLSKSSPRGISALAGWIRHSLRPGDTPTNSVEDSEPLLEIVPMNLEQRLAVGRALNAPLTIVTGPPGTGKSQVVSAILINAVHRGMRVLFASKNHQALDVVETRVNSFSDAPVLLRLGQPGQQCLRLSGYISRLLSAFPTESERDQLVQAKERLTDLHRRLSNTSKARHRLIELRNQVDRLEQEAEDARAYLGDGVFVRTPKLNLDACAATLKAIRFASRRADRERQPWFVRWLWPFIGPGRYGKLDEVLEHARATAATDGDPQGLLDFELTEPPVGQADAGELAARLEDLRDRLELAARAGGYLTLLSALSKKRSLEQLCGEEVVLHEQLASASREYWNCWLTVRPANLDAAQRKILSDYAAILDLLGMSAAEIERLDGGVWSRYFTLSEQAVTMLPCWGITSLSAKGRIPLSEGMFDLLVIDEASQCDIASAVPLLFRARRAVILGDPQQLRHISAVSGARDRQLLKRGGLESGWESWAYSVRSLFDLAVGLCGPGHVVMLRDHHRSHPEIIGFSNEHFYERKLRIATRLDRLRSLGPNERIVRWIHVQGRSVRPADGGLYNEAEVEAVVRELRRLVVEQGYGGSVGVISPFRHQANRIRDRIAVDRELQRTLERLNFSVDSVHRFQGDERDLILFSPVISAGDVLRGVGFLKANANLFHVAVTRAKACLIAIGDRDVALREGELGVGYLRKFAEYVDRVGVPRIEHVENRDLGPEYPKSADSSRVSEWERVLYRELYRAGLRPIPQYRVEKYVVDMAILTTERRLAIEVDGERYHRAWDGELLREDQLRNMRLMELGWDVMRFWVYQVRDDLAGCVGRAEDWLAS